jgi:iron only hydrogenase large subunit-like protein
MEVDTVLATHEICELIEKKGINFMELKGENANHSS